VVKPPHVITTPTRRGGSVGGEDHMLDGGVVVF